MNFAIFAKNFNENVRENERKFLFSFTFSLDERNFGNPKTYVG